MVRRSHSEDGLVGHGEGLGHLPRIHWLLLQTQLPFD